MQQSIRPCRVCGQVKLENGVGDRPMRCRDCFNAWKREKRAAEAPDLTCPRCSATFTRRHGGDKFCSRKCFETDRRVRRGGDAHDDRSCAECGITFTPRRGASKTCSSLCANRARYKRRLQSPEFIEYRKTYARLYYAENRERRLQAGAEWRAKNGERHRQLSREWSRRNRHRVAISWRRMNPEAHAANERVRTARIRALTIVPIRQDQVLARMAYWGFRCWMCSGPFEHVDHVKPIAKGGLNVLSNMRPACGSCNSAKRAKWFGVAELHRFSK